MEWYYISIPKLQRCNRWSLWIYKSFHPTLYRTWDYLSILRLKLIHVNKTGPSDVKIMILFVTKGTFIRHSHCGGHWWPGDAMILGTSTHIFLLMCPAIIRSRYHQNYIFITIQPILLQELYELTLRMYTCKNDDILKIIHSMLVNRISLSDLRLVGSTAVLCLNVLLNWYGFDMELS